MKTASGPVTRARTTLSAICQLLRGRGALGLPLARLPQLRHVHAGKLHRTPDALRDHVMQRCGAKLPGDAVDIVSVDQAFHVSAPQTSLHDLAFETVSESFSDQALLPAAVGEALHSAGVLVPPGVQVA